MKKDLLLSIIAVIFCSCSDDDPVKPEETGPIVAGSENMYMPVGDSVTFTYKSLFQKDTFSLIKMSTAYTRNLQEYINGKWTTTMPATKLFGIGISPATKEHMRKGFLNDVTGFGFHQDASDKYTLLAIEDFMSDNSEVYVIKLPKKQTGEVVYAEGGKTYQFMANTESDTYWGLVNVTSIIVNYEDTHRRVYHFVPGKGIAQLDHYNANGMIESYLLIDVK